MKQNYIFVASGFFTELFLFALVPHALFEAHGKGIAGYEIMERLLPDANIFIIAAALAVSHIAIDAIPFFIERRFFARAPAGRAATMRAFFFFAAGAACSYLLECAALAILFAFSAPVIL